MKGWQNQYQIAQRVNRDDDYFERIKHLEQNEYQTITQQQDILEYKFPQSECFSLGQLIESLNYNFIKIYKGQILIIVLEVLKHLQYLHQCQISHGKLTPQNIIIKLINDKNKLTIVQTKFIIKQVYFINYRFIDDCDYQINYQLDVQQISDCFIQFIKAYQDQKCQLLNLISNLFNEYKINGQRDEDDLKRMIEFFNHLANECIDLEKQKLKKGSTYLSINLNDSNIQNINYQEGDEYNFTTKRSRTKTVCDNFVESLNQQSITSKLEYSQKDAVQDPEQLLDISQLNQDELKIFFVVEQIIKQQIMKTIWNQIGAYLESWDNNFDSKCNAILKEINNANKLILNNQLSLLFKEYNDVNLINNQIQHNIEKNYRFEIQYEEQRAKDVFIQQLKVEAQNYSFNNFQSFINTIKSNVKQELSNYYNQIVMIEIMNLIVDLI